MRARGGAGPIIVAHRGSSALAPENTLAAFTRAVNDGAAMIELDVRMTKDFELVVLHDRTVRRTTNGRGSIWNLTLADLRRFDAGSWYGKEFAGEQIPTLRQVMDFLPARIKLNVEVKTDGERRKRIALQESLILLIRERSFTARVMVSSFDHKFLDRFHQLDPEIPIGVLYTPLRHIRKKPSTIAGAIGSSTVICSIRGLNGRFAEDVHSHKLTLACYGVNTAKQLEKAGKHGVAMVMTDDPAGLRKLMR